MKKTFTYFYKRAARIALIVCALVIGGASAAWADAKSLPYSYGFEDNNLATDGWTSQGLYSLSGIKQSGSYGIVVYDGSYSFRFYNNSSYASQYLISPELESSDTGIDVSFYYTTNLANYNEQFQIGYSTTTSDVSTAFKWYEETPTSDTSWHKYERSFPSGTKYIALLYTYVNDNNRQKIFIDNISIDATETYKRPKSLTVDSYTTSSATLSWTEGGSYEDETWQIAYSTKSDFDPDDEGNKVNVTTNPYTLTGLDEGVTYYAYIRSLYVVDEESIYSEWSSVDEFQLSQDFVANESASTNSSCYVPLYGNKTAYTYKSQFIIPATSLADMQNRQITKLTFYTSQTSISWGASFDIYLKETENSSFSSAAFEDDWGTKVCSATTLSVSEGKMTIELTTPFNYTTGNLLMGFEMTTTGSNSNATWYSVSSNNSGVYYYFSYGTTYYTSLNNYLPMVTITSVSSTVSATIGENGYTTFASPRALDLTKANLPSGVKAYKASVNASAGTVSFTEVNQAVPANTGILLEGTASTTYSIPVAESSSEVSGNDFLVNSTGGTFTADGDYTYFGMMKATSADEAIVFGTFDPASVAIPSNKAYLKVLTSSLPASSSRLTCVFDEADSVEDVVAGQTQGQTQYYDLQGRRVAQPQKGLYIVDGRKVAVK